MRSQPQKVPLSYLGMSSLIMQSASHVSSWNSQKNVACTPDQVSSTTVWHRHVLPLLYGALR